MANAESVTRSIPTTTFKEVEEIHLELSREEAQVLADLFSKIGGAPSTSRRGLTNNIMNALKEVGIWWETSPKYQPTGRNQISDITVSDNSVWFG